jgi:tryptophan synthase alpha chain
VAVGFGISTPAHARSLAPHADAIVVGSALVSELHRAGGDPALPAELVRKLAAALQGSA